MHCASGIIRRAAAYTELGCAGLTGFHGSKRQAVVVLYCTVLL
jgi:hypothetical protein